MLSRSSGPTVLHDDEFGNIKLVRHAAAKYIRLRMQPSGELTVTIPRFAGVKQAERLVDESREDIRAWRQKLAANQSVFQHGDKVGQSHTVFFTAIDTASVKISTRDLTLQVEYPKHLAPNSSTIQDALKPYVEKALQKEARAYLPRRLRYLADAHGFSYERVRFGTQKGRWGSCSSRGTISLNVGLMMLDHELIDYVLIHELCHTKQMNHSAQFWSLVESCLPDYKLRRKTLKSKQPGV